MTLSENVTAGTRVVQVKKKKKKRKLISDKNEKKRTNELKEEFSFAKVHATDKDTGDFGSIQYTRIIGQGSEAFTMDSDRGLITVAMGSSLDREIASRLELSVEARDENGKGNRGVVPLIINLIDVNDNVPIFEKSIYMFFLNSDLTNFTSSATIKVI